MTAPRALVLDLAPSADLAGELVAILEAAEKRIEPIRETVRPADLQAEGVADRVERHRADAVFLLLPDPPVVPWSGSPPWPAIPAFAISETDDPAALLGLLRCGLTDFIRPPLDAAAVLPRLWRSLEHHEPDRRTTRSIKRGVALRRLVGRSPSFLAETEKIPLLASCDVNVLICGETGTGKEVVARAIHHLSPRSRDAFIPVNCGAIPAELVENELFGHERGAFTGAAAARPGLVEEADGGTLMLDEIDSLPALAQVKLLRFLQDREFRRLGSTRVRHGDVRVIAATNGDVEALVEEGTLRRDLYYRLNVVPMRLPPLRERRDDIPLLVRHFLEREARRLGRTVDGFSERAMETFVGHDWPGNVRELEHVVQRALVLSRGRPRIRRRDALLPRSSGEVRTKSFREIKAQVIARFERQYLEKMLTLHGGNISRAAAAAKKNRRAFFELIRKHGIDVQRFRRA